VTFAFRATLYSGRPSTRSVSDLVQAVGMSGNLEEGKARASSMIFMIQPSRARCDKMLLLISLRTR